MEKNNLSKEQRQEKVKKFIEKYKDKFTELEKRVILAASPESSKTFLTDVVRQVFSELEFIDEEDDIYNAFIDIIEKEFGLERNIVEIGGGVVPSLAKKIALKQKTGTITVYDPRLIDTLYSDIPNLTLKRQKFSKETNIPDSNLYIAFMPCEATEMIIEAVGEKKQDFIIAACEGGPHGEMFDYFESDEEWLGCMLYYAKRKIEKADLGELCTTDLEEYNDPYPVFFNRRSK